MTGHPRSTIACGSTTAGEAHIEEVRAALELLADTYHGVWGVLTVADPGVSGPMVLDHFADIGVPDVDFLWPDYHHDDPPPWPSGTLAAYYTELFDHWYDELETPPRIRWFQSVISLLLGGRTDIDALGGEPVTDVMVESDGTWEFLDSLRTCENGITRTGLDVRTRDVEAIWSVPLYQAGLRNQDVLPQVCLECPFRNVCGGGYLAHRYSRGAGFANQSVHCADLLEVFRHIPRASGS